MEELQKKAIEIGKLIDAAALQLKIAKLSDQLSNLQKESTSSNFWNDSAHAQNVMQEISKLETKVKPWQQLQKSIYESQEMFSLNDTSLTDELTNQLDKIENKFEKMKDELKLNGPYDDHDAILSIYAGAGGTDAQDWAQMLLRMYTRFFEKNGWKAITIDQSSGEEAGLKSVTLTISGVDVYGKLKSEHGVHRLVRLSPFNSDNLRQTSFAKVEIIPKVDKPNEAELDEKDLKIDVYRSGGHGGQSVNTTDSAVRVTHIPTGLTVAIQNERSQLQNKETALTILRSRLAQLQLEQHKDHLEDLKGPNQSAEWGNQIRSYVLHPYKQVKDLRTKYESSDPDSVLDGELQPLIDAYLEYNLANK
jgi:peptide chain release factor 2